MTAVSMKQASVSWISSAIAETFAREARLPPEGSQPIDSALAVLAFAQVEEIGEGKDADTVNIARFNLINDADELIRRDVRAAAAIGMHAMEIKSAALNRAYRH